MTRSPRCSLIAGGRPGWPAASGWIRLRASVWRDTIRPDGAAGGGVGPGGCRGAGGEAPERRVTVRGLGLCGVVRRGRLVWCDGRAGPLCGPGGPWCAAGRFHAVSEPLWVRRAGRRGCRRRVGPGRSGRAGTPRVVVCSSRSGVSARPCGGAVGCPSGPRLARIRPGARAFGRPGRGELARCGRWSAVGGGPGLPVAVARARTSRCHVTRASEGLAGGAGCGEAGCCWSETGPQGGWDDHATSRGRIGSTTVG